jgi:hypothetical protein
LGHEVETFDQLCDTIESHLVSLEHPGFQTATTSTTSFEPEPCWNEI